MSAQLICTIEGKRVHFGVFAGDLGWMPICGQQAGRDAWGRYKFLRRIGRYKGYDCGACARVAAQIARLAASTEER